MMRLMMSRATAISSHRFPPVVAAVTAVITIAVVLSRNMSPQICQKNRGIGALEIEFSSGLCVSGEVDESECIMF